MKFRLLMTTVALLAVFHSAKSASAADWCAVYDGSFTGSNVQLNVPQANSNNDVWSNFSARRVSSEMKSLGVYHNVSSVKIRAYDSDVTLYAFTGDHFDGKVNPLFCKKGSVCSKQFGSVFNNKVGSFICQREYRKIPAGTLANQATMALNNPEIPMKDLAQNTWDSTYKSLQKAKFHDIGHYYTNVTWDTEYGQNLYLNNPTHWLQKYIDLVKINNHFKGRPKVSKETSKIDKWAAYTRKIRVITWIRPVIEEKKLALQKHGDPYVKVWTTHAGDIDAINRTMRQKFYNSAVESMTEDKDENKIVDMTDSLRGAILETVCKTGWPAQKESCMETNELAKNLAWRIWGNGKHVLNLGHLPTNEELIDIQENDLGQNSMTDQELSNPTGYGYDVTAFAPVIRLNYQR